MSEPDQDRLDEVVLGNGDTLAERLETLDLNADETTSVDELRERLDR